MIKSIREQYQDYIEANGETDIAKPFEEWCENRLVFAFMQLEAKAAIIDRLYSQINDYSLALVSLAESEHCSYERNEKSPYGIGVTDAHRYCATIAKRALGREVNEGY